MLPTAALDYELPQSLIATTPADPRDSARLMVLSRSRPDFIRHVHIHDLPDLLAPGDLIILNRTRVLPARFRGRRVDTGGAAEGLYLRDIGRDIGVRADPPAANTLPTWQVLLKLRRAKPGVRVELDTPDGDPSTIRLHLLERVGTESGEDPTGWRVAVEGASPDEPTHAILSRVGLTPLPPYILAARRHQDVVFDEARDRDTYQTVFAASPVSDPMLCASIAAPTAGLHFTPELLDQLADRGVHRAEVVLHVGIGTFKPVEAEFVEQHAMHSEWCCIPHQTATLLASAGPPDRTVLAVGTTTARTLESFDSPASMLEHPERDTRILITPGYRFRHFNALLTNFHLPRSTLLAMVAAFIDDHPAHRGRGLERLHSAYRTAIDLQYRFYSFGDAMLILP